jgi:hypothetical protein
MRVPFPRGAHPESLGRGHPSLKLSEESRTLDLHFRHWMARIEIGLLRVV